MLRKQKESLQKNKKTTKKGKKSKKISFKLKTHNRTECRSFSEESQPFWYFSKRKHYKTKVSIIFFVCTFVVRLLFAKNTNLIFFFFHFFKFVACVLVPRYIGSSKLYKDIFFLSFFFIHLVLKRRTHRYTNKLHTFI